MKNNVKNIAVCVLLLSFLAGMGIWLIAKAPDEYSQSERRVLAGKVAISKETVADGSFMSEFEQYTMDQFPQRDAFRTIKAMTDRIGLQRLESNGLLYKGGHVSKLEYPLREDMLEHAVQRITNIYGKYLRDKGITPYFVIVPDKNYYLSQNYEILTMDYDKLYDKIKSQTGYAKHIEVRDLLDAEDYYFTDTHWRQESIADVAERISESMGVPAGGGFDVKTLDAPFYGVYAGQSALPVRPDTIKYLTNDILSSCAVTTYDTGEPEPASIYDMEKASGRDPYEMFLTGSSALITIDNPNADTDKELVIFRDSFGSSLTPLLINAYKKITLIDLRYIQSDMVGNFVEFENQDVLFMYSTLLLNSGLGGGN